MMQGIVDHNRIFTNISVGWPGSVNDARVFRKCNIFRYSTNFFGPNEYLVGDSAYPCKGWCMVPYSRRGNQSAQQKRFNHLHSTTRVVVEHSFGMLKGRFKRLKSMETSLKNALKLITACVVIHNIARMEADEYDPLMAAPHHPLPHRPGQDKSDVAGKRLRNLMAALVCSGRMSD